MASGTVRSPSPIRTERQKGRIRIEKPGALKEKYPQTNQIIERKLHVFFKGLLVVSYVFAVIAFALMVMIFL